MKAIMLVTDSEAIPEFERALAREGHHGFTVLPATAGSGRHGFKAGDRVHPGSSSLLLTVVGAETAAPLVQRLREVSEASCCAQATRIWSFDVEQVA